MLREGLMRSLCRVSVISSGTFHPGIVLLVVVWLGDKECGGASLDCGCGSPGGGGGGG